MPKTNEQGIHERIRQEHDELREMLGKMHRILARRLESGANVAKMLQSLHRHVQTHFDEEEHGGFFDDVVAQAPRLSDRATEVKHEHAWLNNVMRELIDYADDDLCDDWWQRLETKFHEFSKALMHHENKENELLLEAYDDDIGLGD